MQVEPPGLALASLDRTVGQGSDSNGCLYHVLMIKFSGGLVLVSFGGERPVKVSGRR
jgi:hypothetical protein